MIADCGLRIADCGSAGLVGRIGAVHLTTAPSGNPQSEIRNPKSRRSRRHGGILLITIGVLASLVAILAAAAATNRVQLRSIANRTATRRARLMAEAGIQEALVTLSTQSTTTTSQQDDWYQLIGQTGDTRFVVGNDSFRIQIVDAASQVNLNTATEGQLATLPLTQDQIDSLLDWREAGLVARSDGAKDDYYNNLTDPYNTKLGNLTTVDELLLVKGFTPQTLYQPITDVSSTNPLPDRPDGTPYTLYDLCTVDSTSTAGGGGGAAGGAGGAGGGGGMPAITSIRSPQVLTRQGIPFNVANQIFQRRAQLTTYAALLGIPGITTQTARTLVDSYRVGTSTTLTGHIDVNTASEAVLDTIPNMPPDVATAIVSQQSSGIAQLGDLFNVSGFSVGVARQTLDMLSTNSQTFIVHSEGTSSGTTVSLDALISISATGVQILKISEPPYADMSTRWGWDSDTTTDNVLLQAGQQ